MKQLLKFLFKILIGAVAVLAVIFGVAFIYWLIGKGGIMLLIFCFLAWMIGDVLWDIFYD